METLIKGRMKKTQKKKQKNIYNFYKRRKINNKIFSNIFAGDIYYKYKKPLKIFIIFILLVIYYMLKKTKNKNILPNNDYNNININNKKKSNTTIAMCDIAKMENRYIKYFVDYYLKLGYDHIYLYDNNDPGAEKIDDLDIVKDGIKKGLITVISYRPKVSNPVTESYYDCYEKYNMIYNWISFFDIDEFLMIEPKNSTVQEFFESPRYNDCELLKINWRVFNDNDQLDYIDAPLIERFPYETRYKMENRHVKASIRGGLDYHNFRRNGSPHSIYSNIKACSCSGKKTNWNYYLWPPDFSFASLNHYVTKSVTEFFYKKYKSKVDVNTISESWKRYLFNYFFSVNSKTKEKVDIFNKIYHTNYH